MDLSQSNPNTLGGALVIAAGIDVGRITSNYLANAAVAAANMAQNAIAAANQAVMAFCAILAAATAALAR